MKIKNPLFIFPFLFVCFFLPSRPADAGNKVLKIVATQTLFADLVRQVGGDMVDVTAVAAPKFNIHFYQPKPSDVRNVSRCDLYVNAGLDLEAWSDPLLEAAGKRELFRHGPRNLDLSSGVRLLKIPQEPLSRAAGDVHVFGNPHYQMNPQNARIMVEQILAKLQEIDAPNAAYYKNNARHFLTRLEEKIGEWKKHCAHFAGEEIVSYHDDIVYFADFLGLKVEQYLEPKPGIPPTPKHLAFLENYIKEHTVKVIVMPTYYSRKEAEKIAKKVGIKVVSLCQAVGEMPGTGDFFSFFDYNINAVSQGVQ